MDALEAQALRDGNEAVRRNDFAEFFRIHSSLAQAGSALGQYHLGWCYEHGAGCMADHMAALAWYSRAEAGGSREAATAFHRLSQQMRSAVPNTSFERTREG